MKLVIDNRSGNLNENIVIDNCQKDKAIDAINQLDGCRHTLISIERSDMCRLDVGGGDELYIVTCTTANNENYTLLNLQGDESETVELCAGGQFADFPKSITVDKKMVIEAIDSFFDKSENSLDWEKE